MMGQGNFMNPNFQMDMGSMNSFGMPGMFNPYLNWNPYGGVPNMQNPNFQVNPDVDPNSQQFMGKFIF